VPVLGRETSLETENKTENGLKPCRAKVGASSQGARCKVDGRIRGGLGLLDEVMARTKPGNQEGRPWRGGLL